MSSMSAMIALALSFLAITGTSASPLVQRQTGLCNPNFQGVGVSVTNSDSETIEWQLASTAAVPGTVVGTAPFNAEQAEFRFEFTGAPTNTYLIKPLANPELVVASTGQYGILDLAVPNSADPLQAWNVECQSCGSASYPNVNGQYIFDCAISSAANNGLCISRSATGGELLMEECDGQSLQTFDFGSVRNS
jgi:hypothetical protein